MEKKEFIRYIGKDDTLGELETYRELAYFILEYTEDESKIKGWDADHLPAKKVKITIEVID